MYVDGVKNGEATSKDVMVKIVANIIKEIQSKKQTLKKLGKI